MRASPPLLLLAALAGIGCESQSPIRFLELEVEPTGMVAQCQIINVSFKTSGRARYSLSTGELTLATGTTWGGPEEIVLRSDRLPLSTTDLVLSVLAPNGSLAAETFSLDLDRTNLAPIARPRVIGRPEPSIQVMLDGTSSEDPEGDDLTFEWRVRNPGLAAALEGSNQPTAYLTLPSVDDRVDVALTVSDRQGATDTEIVSIRSVGPAGNAPPQITSPASGFDSTEVGRGATVDLRVDATDPDGDNLAFIWRHVGGPMVEYVTRSEGSSISFDAPDTPTLIAFDVVVSDGVDRSAARLEVAVGGASPDVPPTPSIALLDPVRALAPIRLSAEGTTDPDSEDLWFEWYVVAAPERSWLASGDLIGDPGWGVREVTISLDRPGAYEVGLRVADGLGFSPSEATVRLDAILTSLTIHGTPVHDVHCAGRAVAWAGRTGVGARLESGDSVSVSTVETWSVSFDQSSRYLWFGTSNPSAPARLVLARAALVRPTDMEYLEVPEEAGLINEIAIDPAPSRLGDVIIGTNLGTAILDVSATGCASTLGCWVGSPGTGYVHEPPSLFEVRSSEVDVLTPSLDESGRTIVHLGNQYWLIRLERRDDFHDFRHTAIDLFGDRQPQRIGALAFDGADLFIGADPFGLVRRSGETDCGFSFEAPQRCLRTPEGTCAQTGTGTRPGGVVDLASGDVGLVVASAEGFHHYSSTFSRFTLLSPDGPTVAGTPTAVATCDGVVYVGTDQGLWQIALGSDG